MNRGIRSFRTKKSVGESRKRRGFVHEVGSGMLVSNRRIGRCFGWIWRRWIGGGKEAVAAVCSGYTVCMAGGAGSSVAQSDGYTRWTNIRCARGHGTSVWGESRTILEPVWIERLGLRVSSGTLRKDMGGRRAIGARVVGWWFIAALVKTGSRDGAAFLWI